MKRLYIILAGGLMGISNLTAQTLHVKNKSVTYSFAAATTGEMTFSSGNAISILGQQFTLDEGTEMWVDETTVEDNVVTITYSGTAAEVDIAGNIANYVDAEIDGANVKITQSSDVSENTCGEITYRISGSSETGSLYMEGSYKSSIELMGVTLTNPTGAAIDIQNGKRISLSVKSGTVNTLTDGTNGSQKGCIVCKGHLEFKGKGELTVSGNSSHAVYAKEYIELKNCTLNVVSAVKDGINCNQYFMMESGAVNISGTGDDGIQVSYKDDTDREAEDTGAITITGGSLTASVTAEAAKGVKCEGPMLISDGIVTVSVSGHGVWDSSKSKTKASACLASDENMVIDGGNLHLTATGGGGKGINCDGNLTINGGNIEINTSGGIVAYVNGTLYTDYTGNTDFLTSDMKSSPKGVKADGDIEINGGEINVTTTGNGAEGIESKAILTINDGIINVASTDDAINSSSHMYIKGGIVTVVASDNDGLDSNGNMYIEGGYIMAFGTNSPECGIDANEEEGYTVVFTGGTLLAVGGGNSVPSSSSGSTQPYISGSGSVTAGMEISLTDDNGVELATFTVPSNYNNQFGSPAGPDDPNNPGMPDDPNNPGNPGGPDDPNNPGMPDDANNPGAPGGGFGGTSVLITCPGMSNGNSYTLKVGTATSNVKAQLTGSGGGRPW
ncbi:MAG: carbohydrate-binding domain-containing protein [Bacteroides sp.]|nr:carbohydrate-binding domain-containing protein [Bacteroides sp.]